MIRVDAHQHYWQPARGDYDWMPQDDPVLNRPYGPRDLDETRAALGIGRTVLVQAAATVNETEYMLGLADASESIAAVVGWVDFERKTERRTLERLGQHPKFRGVRPMIQDIPDDDWMLRADVQWAFEALCDLDLTFDALGFPRHIDNFLTILTRYPDMRVVLDHCMKPQIRAHSPETYDQWARGMTAVARQTRAFCKFSGLVTEASPEWSIEDLAPYASHVIAAFGPERLMWGSDWPVCRLQADYERWFETALALTAHLSAGEQARIFGGTAAEFYRI